MGVGIVLYGAGFVLLRAQGFCSITWYSSAQHTTIGITYITLLTQLGRFAIGAVDIPAVAFRLALTTFIMLDITIAAAVTPPRPAALLLRSNHSGLGSDTLHSASWLRSRFGIRGSLEAMPISRTVVFPAHTGLPSPGHAGFTSLLGISCLSFAPLAPTARIPVATNPANIESSSIPAIARTVRYMVRYVMYL